MQVVLLLLRPKGGFDSTSQQSADICKRASQGHREDTHRLHLEGGQAGREHCRRLLIKARYELLQVAAVRPPAGGSPHGYVC